MDNLNDYKKKVKYFVEDASEAVKNVTDEVVSKAKELTEEGSEARELAKRAKEQAAAGTLGVKEKIQDVFQDSRVGKELSLGIAELEALPEVEGSILYTMEVESMIRYLKSLSLVIEDKRMDKASAEEEIKEVITKVQPATEVKEDDAEQQAIEKAKDITLNACLRALDALN